MGNLVSFYISMDMIPQDHIGIGIGIGMIHSDHIGIGIGMVVSVEPYNSLQDLQLAVDTTANGILHNMCKMKTKSILKSFESFNTSGLAEVMPSASRAGFSAIPR